MSLFPELRAAPARAERALPPAVLAALPQLPLALFDEIECGLIVCDSKGVVHFANQAARHELATERVLMQTTDGLRRATGAGGDIETALRLATRRGRRSLVRLARDDDHLMVSVLPLHLRELDTPQALLVLGRRQPCSELGLEMLAGSYGLTMAERRVLGGLVREATPKEIASQHAVALSTVRTQISSIRAKLGTRSIEGLLLRAAQVPPVTSALRMAVPSHLPAAPGAATPMRAAA
ncbi:MAG: LuxR C-terminal-related transcriptional regulator [Rubrivivax sp.]|nr:LuxR C-terminal-related transcriptional regulator [Rubrivivax sp.]